MIIDTQESLATVPYAPEEIPRITRIPEEFQQSRAEIIRLPIRRKPGKSRLERKLLDVYEKDDRDFLRFDYAAKLLGGKRKVSSERVAPYIHSFENRIKYFNRYISEVQSKLEKRIVRREISAEDAVHSVERLENMLSYFETHVKESREANFKRKVRNYITDHQAQINEKVMHKNRVYAFNQLVNETRKKVSAIKSDLYATKIYSTGEIIGLFKELLNYGPMPAPERKTIQLPNAIINSVRGSKGYFMPAVQSTRELDSETMLYSLNRAPLPVLLYTRFARDKEGRHYVPASVNGKITGVDLLDKNAYFHAGEVMKERVSNFFRTLVSPITRAYQNIFSKNRQESQLLTLAGS